MIKTIVKSKVKSSSPGDDNILYGFLLNLPTTHHFLATLYNKIDECDRAPDSFAQSNIKMIYKSEDAKDPTNFRMIALTTCKEKIYHQIKALCLIDFMITNGYLHTSTQKYFLQRINGCISCSYPSNKLSPCCWYFCILLCYFQFLYRFTLISLFWYH